MTEQDSDTSLPFPDPFLPTSKDLLLDGDLETYLSQTSLPTWNTNGHVYVSVHTVCCAVLSHSVVSYSLRPHGTVATRLLCPQGFFRQEYWYGLPCPPPEDLPNPGIEPRPPALQADCLPSEPSGKPKNTGVGSQSLLQGIFPTQELNWGVMHFRWILYQMSYWRSPSLCATILESF